MIWSLGRVRWLSSVGLLQPDWERWRSFLVIVMCGTRIPSQGTVSNESRDKAGLVIGFMGPLSLCPRIVQT